MRWMTSLCSIPCSFVRRGTALGVVLSSTCRIQQTYRMRYILVVTYTCLLIVSCSCYVCPPRFDLRTVLKSESSRATKLYAGFGKQASTSAAPTFDKCPCGSQKGYNECCSTAHILMEGKSKDFGDQQTRLSLYDCDANENDITNSLNYIQRMTQKC